MSFSYYDIDGQWYTCQYGNQYEYNPAYWGYYPGWSWVWSGTCGDAIVEIIEYSSVTEFWW